MQSVQWRSWIGALAFSIALGGSAAHAAYPFFTDFNADESTYTSNFKEDASAATASPLQWVGGASNLPNGHIRTGGDSLVGAAVFDTTANSGATDANNDLADFVIGGDVFAANLGANARIGFLLRLNSSESGGYLTTVTLASATQITFSLYKNVGITTTDLTGLDAGSAITLTTPISDSTLFPFKVTATGGTFYFDFNNGAATGTITDPAPLLGAGQAGVWLQAPGGGPNPNASRIDNFFIVPEPASLGLLGLAAVGRIARRRR